MMSNARSVLLTREKQTRKKQTSKLADTNNPTCCAAASSRQVGSEAKAEVNKNLFGRTAAQEVFF
jgi:hypothetical protein